MLPHKTPNVEWEFVCQHMEVKTLKANESDHLFRSGAFEIPVKIQLKHPCVYLSLLVNRFLKMCIWLQLSHCHSGCMVLSSFPSHSQISVLTSSSVSWRWARTTAVILWQECALLTCVFISLFLRRALTAHGAGYHHIQAGEWDETTVKPCKWDTVGAGEN